MGSLLESRSFFTGGERVLGFSTGNIVIGYFLKSGGLSGFLGDISKRGEGSIMSHKHCY